jgi:DnaJ-domain-containing protein 1
VEFVPESRWEKRRRRKDETRADGKDGKDDNVNLGGEEHAWWAGREELDSNKAPSGHSKHKPVVEEPKRNTFEDYFSTESLFDWTGSADSIFDETDPYVVLGLPASASWDEISGAHRRLAKLHHPDRLMNATEEERENSDRRIRELNIAYMELRRRKGR